MGDHWVDMAGAWLNGMPSTAYCRVDAQSDAIQAILSCPHYFVLLHDNPEMARVPWACKGSLLWSVSVAMAFAPGIHRTMSDPERCQNALCAYILWDLWQLISAKKECDTQSPAGSRSMSNITVQNLQAVCLLFTPVSGICLVGELCLHPGTAVLLLSWKATRKGTWA